MFIFQKDRRKTIIINKRYQWRTTLIGMMYIFAVGVFLAIPISYLIRATDGLLSGYSEELRKIFSNLKLLTIASGSLFILSIMVAWVYFSLRQSHKVVGPIVNIARIINEFAKGNFSACIKLRKQDELQDIARALNTMAERLSARERTLNVSLRNRVHAAKEEIQKSASIDVAYETLNSLEEDIEGVLNESPLSPVAMQPETHDSKKQSAGEGHDVAASELLLK